MTTTTSPQVDLSAAVDFMAGNARLLDRHRLALVLGTGGPEPALAALAAYRNADGGYGWGLEPDLRSATSQPGPALHAFEVFDAIGPATDPAAAALCDWLASVTLPDGGLPFALPIPDPAASATWWLDAPRDVSSLQITAIVTSLALRTARHDPAVAAHPWLARATDYCLTAARAAADAPEAPHALVLSFALRFLDAVHDRRPEAVDVIGRLARFVPDDGVLPVAGGTADEAIRPLDIAGEPGTPVRELFSAATIEADLRRLVAGQQPDGGWRVDYAEFSPAGAMEWRGAVTVGAVATLRANGLV